MMAWAMTRTTRWTGGGRRQPPTPTPTPTPEPTPTPTPTGLHVSIEASPDKPLVNESVNLSAVIANAPADSNPSYNWQAEANGAWHSFGNNSNIVLPRQQVGVLDLPGHGVLRQRGLGHVGPPDGYVVECQQPGTGGRYKGGELRPLHRQEQRAPGNPGQQGFHRHLHRPGRRRSDLHRLRRRRIRQPGGDPTSWSSISPYPPATNHPA